MKINNEMTNCSTSNVTAGVLSKNFQKTVEAVVTSNKGFVFTVLAVIRQLGSPTFLCHYHLQIYTRLIL